ncbi:murein hydrolase activator EnvC family protein [Arenimonas fontis]|uniref:Peptidoglycan DD-metalloendopeptidase family protein n=1 Tax=Arenimonas fontis TaxID=2608255 RepID=A0A5B2Z9H6_9GAMM|nr:peptidoglycan DD-metalloendopeptidase family protein [Arenimonas fontis]KAA2284587.1 peptidoglycan DD-metalloendopeptidase family protein [Arenimonas fontis]
MIRILALALLLAAPAASARNDQASEESRAQQRLETLRGQIRTITAEQRAAEGERGQATRALREADARVAEAVRALRRTEAGIATREQELAALEQERTLLEAGLSEQREVLAALVRSAYALGRHEQLKLLLAQDRMADLARVLAYHRYFQADRQQRIAGLVAELRDLAEVARRIQEQRQQLESARRQQQEELARLEAERGERAAVLAELQTGFKDRAARLAALGRDEKAVLGLLERLRDAVADIPRQVDDTRPFASRRGQLPKPLDGRVLAAFGGRLPDGRPSEGWLVGGTAGAEVRAVAPGRVAFSDWLKGYGLLTIIDHGDGWMSLYAFNDALLKDVGDWVRAGEPVATVGSSGGQGRPALYFELRRDGRPQDPRPWLRP